MVKYSSIQTLTITLLCLLSLVLSTHAFALSQVTATVDKNPAVINESILLTVTADDDIARNALDTSALNDDFIVGQTSVSSQTSIINFDATRITKWQIILIARRAGQFTIPALTIEGQQSAPIKLTVQEQSKATDSNSQSDIFVTSELSSSSVYVQQSLTLTIKLHFAVDLKSGSLTEPTLPGATINKVGQDKQTDGIINGKRYRIIEQTYAITPEQSGEFTLQAPVFSGDILQSSNRRSNFLSFAQTKPVSIIGDELPLTVLPIPVNYPTGEQWLPTEILTLHQEWPSNSNEFTVGEPITRTITLTAAGLAKAQLPVLKMDSIRGLKVYPDQPELHSTMNSNRLVSQKIQSFAIVPSMAGQFNLPAMSITWFNTVTNKIEQATLPAETIHVKAAEAGYGTPTTSPFQTQTTEPSSLPTQALNQLAEDVEQSSQINNNIVQVDNRLQWLFLVLWLLTLIAWFLHIIYLKKSGFTGKGSPDNKSMNKAMKNSDKNKGKNYLTLLAACKKNDAEQTINLVLPWLKTLLASSYLSNTVATNEIHTIEQAQTLIKSPSFDEALHELQQYLYGNNTEKNIETWQGDTLFSAIKQVNDTLSKEDKQASVSALSLNP